MDLASISLLLEMGDEQFSGRPIFLSHSRQFYDAYFKLSLEELCVELPFHLLPTCMEFLGNEVYQVNVALIKELGNNLSLK